MKIVSLTTPGELLILVADGNENAFRKLFDRYKDKVYNYSFYFSHSASAAEEITQDVFLKLWISRESLRDVQNIDAWLAVMTRNHCLNYLKKAALENKLHIAVSQRAELTDQNVDNYIFYKEQQGLLIEAISQLSPQQKIIFSLNRDAGLKNEEIARQLNLSTNTVKSHMVSALRKIRHFLETHPAQVLLLLVSLLKKF
jgi:RNA polymerase sigma-70 factor (ECF subfamily)